MAHLTVAVSEGTFKKSFEVLERNFKFEAAIQSIPGLSPPGMT